MEPERIEPSRQLPRLSRHRTAMGAFFEVVLLLAIVAGVMLAADYMADLPSAKPAEQTAPDLDLRG